LVVCCTTVWTSKTRTETQVTKPLSRCYYSTIKSNTSNFKVDDPFVIICQKIIVIKILIALCSEWFVWSPKCHKNWGHIPSPIVLVPRIVNVVMLFDVVGYEFHVVGKGLPHRCY
jgi:hypothetical protein